MSNSFSGYRGKALKGIGGFSENVIVSAGMYVDAKMLLVAYKLGQQAQHLLLYLKKKLSMHKGY